MVKEKKPNTSIAGEWSYFLCEEPERRIIYLPLNQKLFFHPILLPPLFNTILSSSDAISITTFFHFFRGKSFGALHQSTTPLYQAFASGFVLLHFTRSIFQMVCPTGKKFD